LGGLEAHHIWVYNRAIKTGFARESGPIGLQGSRSRGLQSAVTYVVMITPSRPPTSSVISLILHYDWLNLNKT